MSSPHNQRRLINHLPDELIEEIFLWSERSQVHRRLEGIPIVIRAQRQREMLVCKRWLRISKGQHWYISCGPEQMSHLHDLFIADKVRAGQALSIAVGVGLASHGDPSVVHGPGARERSSFYSIQDVPRLMQLALANAPKLREVTWETTFGKEPADELQRRRFRAKKLGFSAGVVRAVRGLQDLRVFRLEINVEDNLDMIAEWEFDLVR